MDNNNYQNAPQQYQQAPPKSKGIGVWPMVIGGAVLLLAMNSGGNPISKVANKTFDPTDIMDAFDSPTARAKLLGTDTSPKYFSVSGSAYTTAEREALIEKIMNKSETLVNSLAQKIETSSANVGRMLGVLISKAPNMTQEQVNLYMQMFGYWVNILVDINQQVTTGLIAIQAQAGLIPAQASTCVETTFIQNLTSSTTYNNTVKTTVEVTNRAGSAVFGLIKWGSDKLALDIEESITQTQNQTSVYVPHCTEVALDPQKVMLLQSNINSGYVLLYSQLEAVFNMMPDPENF